MASPDPSARSCTVRGVPSTSPRTTTTTVEWTYVYLPRSPLYAPFVAFVIGVFWRRYMARALATALGDVEARAIGPGALANEAAA